MNPLQKLWCRTFQAALRLALPVLPYRDPALLDRVDQVPEVLKDHSLSRPLVVTDGSIRSLGLTAPLEEALTCGQ